MINLSRNQHGLKMLRRFKEDIFGNLALVEKPLRLVNYLYAIYQSSYVHKQLLIKTRRSFFLEKRQRFLYKVITGEKEFKNKKRTLKTMNYLMLLKIRRFYGNLGAKKFKRVCKQSFVNPNILGLSFVYFLEARLDVLLYRANFFRSVFSSRQCISHNGIFVNGLPVNRPGVRVNINDIVTVSFIDNLYKAMASKLSRGYILGNFPAYLEVNYKIGSAMLSSAPDFKHVPFPFFMNLQDFAHNFLR